MVDLLSNGKLNKQIAFHLDITEATVKAHLSSINRKLHVRTRVEAAVQYLNAAP